MLIEMLQGRSTRQATATYAERHPNKNFFRAAQDVTVSSLGLGTYLGERTEAAIRGYRLAIRAALEGGINFIDTSLNYRQQQSERDIGAVLAEPGAWRREELVIATKAGYLVRGAIPESLRAEEVAGGQHSLSPDFLANQLARSRDNLGVETIDIFYLHNPETQLDHVPMPVFEDRIRRAFHFLEGAADSGAIRWYGVATWSGLRRRTEDPKRLSLIALAGLAQETAGSRHRFRFAQLPFNLGMVEAYTQRNEHASGRPETLLEAAARLEITAVASASLLQARLARELPQAIAARIPDAPSDAVRALQFARSTPGITTALAGMGNPAHVAENLAVKELAPLEPAAYRALYSLV